MGDKSKIEWLAGGATWNPIRARRKSDGKKGWACVRVSPGCEHCYSEKQNVQCGTNPTRHGTGLKYTVPALQQVELFLDEQTLLQPLSWRKGRMIFPCSMTDWMADFVPDEWRDKMLAVMACARQHTFLALTKRADRQLAYLTVPDRRAMIAREANAMMRASCRGMEDALASVFTWSRLEHGAPGEYANYLAGITDRSWPLPNLWLGVSAEDQPRADERIPLLRQTPAAVRWVSGEPLLGAIDFRSWLNLTCCNGHLQPSREQVSCEIDDCCEAFNRDPLLHWIVAGGESGPGARPMQPNWARSLRDQCQAAGVPFFFKQWGEWAPLNQTKAERSSRRMLHRFENGAEVFKLGKAIAGRLLDGKEWSEYPKVAEAVNG